MVDPLYIFVFAGLFSPGPNVIMLTTSGAQFGFSRTLPHLFGVVIGVGITAALTGFGIGALLDARQGLQIVLKISAAIWIFYMAFQLWQTTLKARANPTEKPFSFVEAVLFQWINPKVWAVAISASAGYSAGLEPLQNAFRLGFAFSGLNLFVCLFWTFAGSLLAMLITNSSINRVFLRIMAILLACSAVLVFV